MAREGIALISQHEKVCAERWDALKRTMDVILRVLAWGTAGLISTMGGMIGWMITHQPH